MQCLALPTAGPQGITRRCIRSLSLLVLICHIHVVCTMVAALFLLLTLVQSLLWVIFLVYLLKGRLFSDVTTINQLVVPLTSTYQYGYILWSSSNGNWFHENLAVKKRFLVARSISFLVQVMMVVSLNISLNVHIMTPACGSDSALPRHIGLITHELPIDQPLWASVNRTILNGIHE